METISTLLVEDRELTRLGIRKALEDMSGICIVAEAASGAAAVRLAKEMCPDLVLMDIGLPDMDGIEAVRLIKRSQVSKIIMLTSHDGQAEVLAALAAGADAYCIKDISATRLANVIYAVMEGTNWTDPQIRASLLQSTPKPPLDPLEFEIISKIKQLQLSKRELEVLALLVDGMTNQQIADKLSVSTETIKTHMRHLLGKMKVTDRTQAAVKAVREGLVPPIFLNKNASL